MEKNFNPNTSFQFENEEATDYKRILFLFVQNWHWFTICVGIMLAATFLYTRYYKQETYTVNTSILITDDNKSGNLEDLFEKSLMNMGSSVTIDNEVELLRSYTLSHRVFENLNWRVSWYKKEYFRLIGLYPNDPFILQEEEKAANLEGLLLMLEVEKDSTYTLSADGNAFVDGEETAIEFDQKGKFGESFHNEYFHFTIHLNGSHIPETGDKYGLRFSNVNALTRSYLKKQQIEPTGKNSDVIRLTIEGTQPMREIHYLNGLVNEYINQNLEFRTETQKRTLEFINKQLSGMSDSLSAAETTVTRFRSENQVLDITAEGGMVMQQMSDIEKERSQSQMQLDYFQNLLSYMGNTDSIKNIMMPSVVGIQDPSLNAVVLKLSDLYSRRAILSFSTHENNPTLILLDKEIDQVTHQLRENLLNLIDNARVSIQTLQSREAAINQQLNNLPVKEQQLINITRQYDLTSEIYTYLLQKQAETDIALASAVSNTQVIDPARVERVEESGTSARRLYLFAFVLGLILPALAIIGLDTLNNTIHLQEDVEKLTQLTIIGNVPHSSVASELAVIENPRAPVTEAYRAIRTNLQYLMSQSGQQVIGIHSIRPGEGKSFSSINLACILALNDKKVLMVGADMRKPRLHLVTNTSNGSGLSTFLIGQSSYEEIIQKTSVQNLWLVPSGPVPPNPAELLERNLYKIFIERARKEFDFIVIDNAPVSMVTDGMITARQSDLNIFILRYGVSQKDQLKFINDIAAKEVMKHPALVINDIKGSRYGYGYSSYSYNYGYYAEGDRESWYRKRMRRLLGKVNKFKTRK
ncbi:MAG: polysaccharide biosynthesis tyrosine autokinase [Prolixibacteraceae bacterium]